MKRRTILFVSAIAIVIGCSRSGEPCYEKGTREYTFFKKVADSLDVKMLNPDRSVALIGTNKFKIGTKDVMHNIYLVFQSYTDDIRKIPAAQVREFLRQLATREAETRMMLLSAEENNITVPRDTIDAQIKKVFDAYGGEENFTKEVTRRGLTVEEIKKEIANNMIVQKYLDDVVFKDVNVSEDEIKAKYKDERATVRHILFLTQGKSTEEKKKIYDKAKRILALAKSGEDFAALAKEYSEDPGSKDRGGLYENFPRGQMVKPFEDAAFNLPVGSISDIVETRYGYHIIKILERSSEKRPYNEVREEIKNSIIGTKKQNAYIDHINYLKEKYDYKILVDFEG